MKLFGFLAVCLTLVLSAAANPIEPRVPDPHWWNDVENWAKGVVNDLSDAGKSVWNGLKKAEQKVIATEKALEKDGCKIVPCALELGVTSTKCIIAARQYGANTQADMKCLHDAVKTGIDMEKHHLCAHCWQAVEKYVKTH